MKIFGKFDGFRYTFEKMELPKWYRKFTHEVLLLEGRIHAASEITTRLFSSQLITDRIASQQKQKVISERQMFFGFMDNLMNACGLDVETIWTYRSARDAILAGFAACASESFEYLPEALTTSKLMSFATTLGTKGVVEKIVHTQLYPSHAFLPESVWLTVYPFEKALGAPGISFICEVKKASPSKGLIAPDPARGFPDHPPYGRRPETVRICVDPGHGGSDTGARSPHAIAAPS
jgi:N-acetylmuramoyl-L-alanine amidase